MPVNFRGFTFWLVSGGVPIEEYNVQIEDRTTISCYIPSETGKEFVICWKDEGDPSSSVVAFHMDGRPVGGKPSVRGVTGVNEGAFVGPHKLRPFVFGNIVTTDDEDIASPDGADPDLGCIHIEVLRVRNIARVEGKPVITRVHDVGPVHERSKKLGAHVVSLGQEQKQWHGEFFSPTFAQDNPYAVFRFMYRPRELLMARGIMPLPSADVVDEKKPIINGALPAPLLPRDSPEAESSEATTSAAQGSTGAAAVAPKKRAKKTKRARKARKPAPLKGQKQPKVEARAARVAAWVRAHKAEVKPEVKVEVKTEPL